MREGSRGNQRVSRPKPGREPELYYAPGPMRSVRPLLLALSLLAAAGGCASRESLGTRSMAVLGAGVVNDPENKSLRFDLLKFGLESFCEEMRRTGTALRLGDDEPVLGRFYASACSSQIIDEPERKSFVVQYAGQGFASSPQGGRVAFSTTGLVEYAPDFLLHEGALYVYFRPRVVDATGFTTLLVESQLATTALRLFGVDADAFGRRVVESQLRRGFTVIRHDDDGRTEFGLGVVPLGERPYRPFDVQTENKRVLANERTEVHLNQQDFVGPFEVDEDEAIYLTAVLDGTAAADVLVVREDVGRSMIEHVLKQPGPATPSAPALLDEPILQGALWQRYALVPEGKYYVVIDNTGSAGRTSPPPGAPDGRSARVDVLVMVGERP